MAPSSTGPPVHPDGSPILRCHCRDLEMDQAEDALIVLRAATRLVVDFVIEDDPAPIASKVFTLVRDPA